MKIEKIQEEVRNNIILSAKSYRNVVGKYYLYIFENFAFEMYYGIENFKHLTGAYSALSPKSFYSKAKSNMLQTLQLSFNSRFPLKTSLKKTRELIKIDDFVSHGFFIVKDYQTKTEIYPYAITNLDNSLFIGLMTEEDEEIYAPKSFRVKDRCFDKSEDDRVFQIDYILSKTDKQGLYNTVMYCGKESLEYIDDEIKKLIDKSLF